MCMWLLFFYISFFFFVILRTYSQYHWAIVVFALWHIALISMSCYIFFFFFFWCCRYKLRITLFISRERKRECASLAILLDVDHDNAWKEGNAPNNFSNSRINKKFHEKSEEAQSTKKKWLNHKIKYSIMKKKNWSEKKHETKNQTAHLYILHFFFFIAER